MAKYLLIDGSPLLYQSHSAVGHFKTSTGISTGIRYGFIRSCRSWKNKFGCDKVIVAWDSVGPVEKVSDGLESYKANRIPSEAKTEMYSQLDGVKQMLSLTSVDQVSGGGFEADDLLGCLARRLEKQGHTVVIATVDRDLFSAVSESVTVFHTLKKKELVDAVKVEEYFGVPPYCVPMHKAILGDKSDNLSPMKLGTRRYSKDRIPALIKLHNGDAELLSQLLSVNLEELKKRHYLTSLSDYLDDDVEYVEGKADFDGLNALFELLEFKSMMKFVGELTEE